jgi:hypothetical protein
VIGIPVPVRHFYGSGEAPRLGPRAPLFEVLEVRAAAGSNAPARRSGRPGSRDSLPRGRCIEVGAAVGGLRQSIGIVRDWQLVDVDGDERPMNAASLVKYITG